MQVSPELQRLEPAKQQPIRIGCVGGNVVVLFDKPVDHLQLSKQEATQYVKILIDKINELTMQTGDGRLIGARN